MAGAFGIGSFVLALILAILVHEAAHFGVAKAFRIKVDEFFLGFGPKIWSVRRGETEYGIKAIPAGGYVKIAGMNPFKQEAPEDLPRTYGAKPVWQRALVIVAGPATHFVLAFVFFGLWLGLVGAPTTHSPIVSALATVNGQPSPAQVAGLVAGDRVVGIGDIRDPTDTQLTGYTRSHVGQPIQITVLRNGRELTFEVTPVVDRSLHPPIARIGFLASEARAKRGLVGSVTGGFHYVGTTVAQIASRLGDVFGPTGIHRILDLLFTNAARQPTDPQSVIGAARIAQQVANSSHFWDILLLLGYINVFIGLVNLLPLPPFDGGHLAVLAIEKVRGKAVDARKVVPVAAVVVALLALLTLSVVLLDILKPLNVSP